MKNIKLFILNFISLLCFFCFFSCKTNIENTADKTPPINSLDKEAPNCVSNLSIESGDGKAILRWINPKDQDLSKIIISCDRPIKNFPFTITSNVTPNNMMVQEINGLTNGTKYTFRVKVIDKAENKSLAKQISITPNKSMSLPGVEDSPVILENYNGSAGNGWTYISFGIWPQTKYSGDINLLKACCNINAWENCYTDGDGNYYVKVNANPYEMDYKYSDGESVVKGQDYYFKLEPIIWRVLANDYCGKDLFLAEKVLYNIPYFSYKENDAVRTIDNENIYNNNYKYSEVRAFLNGYNYVTSNNNINSSYLNKGFLQKAFSKEAIKMIADTVVDNSSDSTTDSGNNVHKATTYICDNTTDKIFLLSEKEVTSEEYGFDLYNLYLGDTVGTKTSTRLRCPTDYAKATGLKVDSLYNSCQWWLRSPHYKNNYFSCSVYTDTIAHFRDCVNITKCGIVPALSISFF